MLPGVLLHMVQAPVPVQVARNLRPHRNRALGGMEDAPLPLAGLQHRHLPDPSPVGKLAAPLREKGGAVQNNVIPIYYRLAVQNYSLPPGKMAVLVVKSDGFHIQTPLAIFSSVCRRMASRSSFVWGNHSDSGNPYLRWRLNSSSSQVSRGDSLCWITASTLSSSNFWISWPWPKS